MNARADMLEFDALDHEYTVNGVVMPSVTQVMASQFPLGDIPPARLEFARQMGVAIHSCCEFYDRGTLDWKSADPLVVPYIEAWIKFRKDVNCKIIDIESRVWHPVLRYAGTPDRIITIANDVYVIDLKRPTLGYRVGVQTAAYMQAYNEQKSLRVTRRLGLQLKSDGNYRLREYKDPADWSVFVASLTIFNWRKQHGE